MIDINDLASELKTSAKTELLKETYPGKNSDEVIARILSISEQFTAEFGEKKAIGIYSAPGRTEIGGNHTDHQGGKVVAAAINLDTLGVASPNGSSKIRVISKGHGKSEIDVNDLDIIESEYNTTQSLLRGVAAGFADKGCVVSGFDAYVESDVLIGSGLSSSASFEVWLGVAINDMFCENKVGDEEIAKIGQYAENQHFGKPCGLMDQMASSVGGVVSIDFVDENNAKVTRIDFDFDDLALCIIDSGAEHSDLTDEYASITREMGLIAGYFGKKLLSEIDEDDFWSNVKDLTEIFGDRAVLRAFHYYSDNARVEAMTQAIKSVDENKFLDLINASGRSSYMYLQNIYPAGATNEQAVATTLALCDHYLDGVGAFRVHGGGFAGTIQAFVPKSILSEFVENIEKAHGNNTCHVLDIRPWGGKVII